MSVISSSLAVIGQGHVGPSSALIGAASGRRSIHRSHTSATTGDPAGADPHVAVSCTSALHPRLPDGRPQHSVLHRLLHRAQSERRTGIPHAPSVISPTAERPADIADHHGRFEGNEAGGVCGRPGRSHRGAIGLRDGPSWPFVSTRIGVLTPTVVIPSPGENHRRPPDSQPSGRAVPPARRLPQRLVPNLVPTPPHPRRTGPHRTDSPSDTTARRRPAARSTDDRVGDS